MTLLVKMMATHLCPTCGCSLVRLGISEDDASRYCYQDNEYYFCCDGCVNVFTENPEKYIKEIENVIVCPDCLAEKTIDQSVKQNHKGNDVFFCRCTHCMKEFSKRPDYYLDRLEGKIDHQGLFGNSCCQN